MKLSDSSKPPSSPIIPKIRAEANAAKFGEKAILWEYPELFVTFPAPFYSIFDFLNVRPYWWKVDETGYNPENGRCVNAGGEVLA